VYLNILFGIASGIVTGLLPGIHVNTVVAIMLSRAITDPIGASIYILSLAITHSITEFIPTAFLGIPDSTTAEAQLPAHELAQSGRAFEALSISVIASLSGGLLSLLIAPLAIQVLFLLGLVFSREMVVVTLALFILIPNLRSKRWSVVFATAAAISLGFVSLQGDLLMPLLAGLFGVPHILEALRSKASAPIITSTRISRPAAVPLFASVPIGFLFSFLPGAGSSTASYFVSRYLPWVASTPERIIALNSSLSTVNYATSIYTFVYLDRARNGAVVGIRELAPTLGLDAYLLVIGVTLFLAAGVSMGLGLVVARLISRVSQRAYLIINLLVLAANAVAVLFLAGFIGILFGLVCTIVGSWALKRGVPKVCLLACLTGPTLWLIA
jgi:putative membrane protein